MTSPAFPVATPEGDTVLAERDEVRAAPPKPWKVLLLNDNYTTMEFVVEILMTVFGKTAEESVEVMLHVHHRGKGVAGVYAKEIAETKAHRVETMAHEAGFPLKTALEEG